MRTAVVLAGMIIADAIGWYPTEQVGVSIGLFLFSF